MRHPQTELIIFSLLGLQPGLDDCKDKTAVHDLWDFILFNEEQNL